MKDTAWAKAFFAADRFATDKAQIEILQAKEAYSRCRMPISPSHLNAGGVVMGGAIFTLADFAFAVAANTPDSVCVSLSATMTFMAPARGAYLEAEAVCTGEGKSVCFYDVTVYDDKGNAVAKLCATGYKKPCAK